MQDRRIYVPISTRHQLAAMRSTHSLVCSRFSAVDTYLTPATVLQATQSVIIDTNIQTKAGASVSQLLTSTQGQAGLVVRPCLALLPA